LFRIRQDAANDTRDKVPVIVGNRPSEGGADSCATAQVEECTCEVTRAKANAARRGMHVPRQKEAGGS